MLPMWKCCQYQCCQFQLKLGIGNGNIGNWQHLFRPGGPKCEGGEAGDESWLGGERRRGGHADGAAAGGDGNLVIAETP